MNQKRSGFLALAFFYLLCGLMVSSLAAQASDVDDFLAANRAYEAGDFPRAIELYEILVANEGLSASLCYNLANSYARNGQTGRAVLGYERALFLAPGDADTRANLELLRKEKGLMQEPLPLLQRVGGVLGLNQWTVLATALLTVLVLLHLATLRFPLSARMLYSLSCACLLLFVICSTGVAIQYRNWQQAVILTPDTRLLISPFDGAESTAVIEEGRLVRVIKNHKGYALVKDEKGRSGWISDISFESIAMIMANKKNL